MTITAGVNMDAKLILADSADGTGARFELFNDGSASSSADNCPTGNCPVFRITDGTDTMMSITDRGDIGDLYVSGSALFGGPAAGGDRDITVQSSGEAKVSVISGPGNDAVVTITAGEDQDAKLILEDPADGASAVTGPGIRPWGSPPGCSPERRGVGERRESNGHRTPETGRARWRQRSAGDG